jgi:hypothetical protein
VSDAFVEGGGVGLRFEYSEGGRTEDGISGEGLLPPFHVARHHPTEALSCALSGAQPMLLAVPLLPVPDLPHCAVEADVQPRGEALDEGALRGEDDTRGRAEEGGSDDGSGWAEVSSPPLLRSSDVALLNHRVRAFEEAPLVVLIPARQDGGKGREKAT